MFDANLKFHQHSSYESEYIDHWLVWKEVYDVIDLNASQCIVVIVQIIGLTDIGI